MLSDTQVQDVAAELLKAEATRQQTGLLSVRYPDITLDDAYAIQGAQLATKLAAGRRILGWKIGLTSKVMQTALGIDTPDSGVLYDDMLFPDGGQVPRGRFIEPRVEAEIAFVMKAPIDGNVSREDVIAATDYVSPALEILDTRILRADPDTGTRRCIFDTVADNAANAGVVLGAQRHDPSEVDLRWVGAIVEKDGEVTATGLGAAVLNDPIMGLIWLARRMASYGHRIEPGQIVLTGSFIGPIECPAGTAIRADFGPFGTVSTKFA